MCLMYDIMNVLAHVLVAVAAPTFQVAARGNLSQQYTVCTIR
jgi:hypothetical protein